MGNWLFRQAGSLRDRISRRLVNKLIMLFSTIIILIVASLTVISYRMLRDESVGNGIASTSNNLHLVNQNLEGYLDGIEELSLPNIRYEELSQAIQREQRDYSAKTYLEDYLRQLYFSRNDIRAIFLYLVEQGKYYSITKEDYNVAVRTGTSSAIENRDWYLRALDNSSNQSFQSFAESPAIDTGYPVESSAMAHHRVLRTIANRKPQAVISFFLDDSAMKEILMDVPFNEGQHLMYLSPEGEPFFLDDFEFYGRSKEEGLLDKLLDSPEGRFAWEDGGKKYLVIHNTGEARGWKLVKPIPYAQLNEPATKARNISFAFGLAFLLIAVMLVSFTSNAITRPLKKLSIQMNRFSSGDFDVETVVKGRDEIAYLSRHFNQMVRRTNELINERYKMKLVEKNAILKALEAEINPHFLYNALQAISTKALKNERYDIADMVDALAMTLRYCISGKDIVYAREELRHIERYLALQKARFGQRLQVEYDWDESLMELKLPKLSLQTLVENAVKHALEQVSSTVTLSIGASVDRDQAVIVVQDDGPGFEEDKLRLVLQSFQANWEDRPEHAESIGLVNLNTRLKLLYGNDAELSIRTGEAGTAMEMRIPRGNANDG